MEQLKDWIKSHKALAIGGGLAIVVLLYLWLRSGSSAAAPAADPLGAYYAAQAAAAGDTAQTAQSTNALQASSEQTNAQQAVDLAAIAAENTPANDQLAAIENQTNLTAYQDYLAEQGGSGTGTSSATPPFELGVGVGTGDPVIWNSSNTIPALSTLYDLTTGAQAFNAAGGPLEVVPGSLSPVNWAGPGSSPTPWSPPPPAPTSFLTFAQFTGQVSGSGNTTTSTTPTPTAATIAAATNTTPTPPG